MNGLRIRPVFLFLIPGCFTFSLFSNPLVMATRLNFLTQPLPLVFFYTLVLIAFLAGSITGVYLFLFRIFSGPVFTTSALFSAFLIISGLQFLLFAMWFDMENNKGLKG
jgi:hypothetical protein